MPFHRKLLVRIGNVPESGKSQPQQEDELEDEVKGEPVDNAEEALDNGEESENNPVLRERLAVTRLLVCAERIG